MRSRFNPGDWVPGWACVADEVIIKRSAEELVSFAGTYGWSQVILPRPGCGAGELSWEQVKPILTQVLDDRFYVITFPPRR